MGYGGVIKISIQFDEPFWEQQLKKMGFIFSDERIAYINEKNKPGLRVICTVC